MRQHGAASVAAALSEEEAENQTRHTREDVDDESAREIECTELREEAAAPDPVRHGVIEENDPEQDKENEGAETDALGKRAADECRCNNSKHTLKRNKGEFRDRCVRQCAHAHPRESELRQTADEAAVRSEYHRIAEEHPLDGDQRHHEEALHDGRQHVLAAHHTAVEERQPRRHDKHHRRADEHIGGIAAVDRPRLCRERRAAECRHEEECSPRNLSPSFHKNPPMSLMEDP